MGPRPLDITEALAEAARAMTQSSSLEEKLDAIVHTALGSMPGFDHVGTSITHRHGEIETKAATDQLVWQLDALQYEFGEGPCFDAITTPPGEPHAVAVEHAASDERWPTYRPKAVAAGLKAQLGISSTPNESRWGARPAQRSTRDTQGHRPGDRNHHGALRHRRGESLPVSDQIRVSSTSNIKLRLVAAEVIQAANDRAHGADRT